MGGEVDVGVGKGLRWVGIKRGVRIGLWLRTGGDEVKVG